MTNENVNEDSGERLSFYQLFLVKNMCVEIPIIQRDFAQGRDSESEVRTVFLQALYDYLQQGRPFRDLDFVYGGVLSSESNLRRFIPLDGQQRLTTLFLLHWYLAQISGNSVSFRKVLGRNDRSLFTYETRSSSREFCDALVRNDIDFENLLELPQGNESLKATIQDRAWFFLSWNSDPTIKSMLTMLEAIHSLFAGRADFFERLVDVESPVITFLFLNLDKFKLTDDLYIKMNARGKPLSDFENFKARLQKEIKSYQGVWPEYVLSFKSGPVSGYEYFIHKIDSDWADLFWGYKNVSTKGDSYDNEIMNFISLNIANFQLLRKDSESDALIRRLFGVGGKLTKLSFIEYERLKCFSQDLIEDLITVFDLVRGDSLTNGRLTPYLERNSYHSEDSIFRKVIANEASFPEKLRFFAFYTAIANHKKGEELLAWMRVVFNLTENTIINNVQEYRGALRSINDLARSEKSIVELLKQDCAIESFNDAQVFEEKIKAYLWDSSPEWRSEILRLEGHSFLRGQIGFVLSFSGIVAFYSKEKNTNWGVLDSEYFKEFQRYSRSAAAVFTCIEKDSSIINFSWERAVLSKGDYLTTASANRFNLLSTRLIKNNIERDHSWRRMLRLSLRKKDVWSRKQDYVKAVFDDPSFNAGALQSSLETICQNASTTLHEKDWRTLLVRFPELFALCNQGFIVNNDSEVILLHESQRNHYQSELYSKFLECELRAQTVDVTPFERTEYYSVKNRQDNSYLSLSGFRYSDRLFSLHIWYENKLYYLLLFCEDAREIEFSNELLMALNRCEFASSTNLMKNNPEAHEYGESAQVYICDTPKQALAKSTELCKILREFTQE